MKGSGSRPRGDAIKRLDKQIKRAAELARVHEGPIAELYTLHMEICERNRTRKLRRRLYLEQPKT